VLSRYIAGLGLRLLPWLATVWRVYCRRLFFLTLISLDIGIVQSTAIHQVAVITSSLYQVAKVEPESSVDREDPRSLAISTDLPTGFISFVVSFCSLRGAYFSSVGGYGLRLEVTAMGLKLNINVGPGREY
jgi:hypothetical protein